MKYMEVISNIYNNDLDEIRFESNDSKLKGVRGMVLVDRFGKEAVSKAGPSISEYISLSNITTTTAVTIANLLNEYKRKNNIPIYKDNPDKNDYSNFKSMIRHFVHLLHSHSKLNKDDFSEGEVQAGKGYRDDKIRGNYSSFSSFSNGHNMDISIQAGWALKTKANYLHWTDTNINIIANWFKNKDIIESLSITKDGKSIMKYSLETLELENVDINQTIIEFYNNYNKILKTTNTYIYEYPTTESFDSTKIDERALEISEKLMQSKNIILRGAPGTGKTYLARQVASKITSVNLNEISDCKYYEFVQFHPSYDYTDFVEGLRPDLSNNNTEITFTLVDGIFKSFCKRAMNDPNNNYIFVIDEINRGEISKILGELFYLIEPSYRGKEFAISTQYSNINNDELFYIPKNVYLLGTMNDIDRSVDTFDFAMRRRFRFLEIRSQDTISMLNSHLDFSELENAKTRHKSLNDAISEIDDLNLDYHIGASYFIKLHELSYNYDLLWSDYIEPLLTEYLRGTYQEKDKIKILKKAYDLRVDLDLDPE